MDLTVTIATLLRQADPGRAGLERALDAILAAILERTATTSGTLHLLPQGETSLQLMASRDIPPVVLDRIRVIPIGKGMAGVAVERCAPVTTCNLQIDDAGGVIRQGARETGARGAVAVPLLRGTTAVGALGVATREPRDFTRAEIDAIQALGCVLAEALALVEAAGEEGGAGAAPVPTVTVFVPPPLRECSGGQATLSLPAASVRAALAELQRRHPGLHRGVCDETGAVRRHVNLFVNETHIRDRDGLDTLLAPGDVVMILPAVSGG